MREIIFRGKRVENGEWVYGMPIWDESLPEPMRMIVANIERYPYGNNWEVVTETIGQYTGYQEKKTGKMLFDGDNFIVETWEGDGRKSLAYFTVCWDSEGLCWNAKSFADSMFDELLGDIVDDSLEIIGNIHDKEQPDGQEH
jgi:hypothetical protein